MEQIFCILAIYCYTVSLAQPGGNRNHQPPAQANNKLCCNQELAINATIESPNKRYYLIFQGDKNLVLYKRERGNDKPLWATATNNRVNRCVMQADGNLVLYNNASAVWASNTGGNRNAKLVIQDDGNLVIYSATGRAVWATNTAQSFSQPTPQPAEEAAPAQEAVEVVTTNNEPCAMSHADFNAAVDAINNQSFKDPKMAVAKQAIKNKCLSLNQIRELAGLFSFEDQTLEFIKYAYDFTNSKGDYYTLSDIFSFNSNVKNFTAFLETKK